MAMSLGSPMVKRMYCSQVIFAMSTVTCARAGRTATADNESANQARPNLLILVSFAPDDLRLSHQRHRKSLCPINLPLRHGGIQQKSQLQITALFRRSGSVPRSVRIGKVGTCDPASSFPEW